MQEFHVWLAAQAEPPTLAQAFEAGRGERIERSPSIECRRAVQVNKEDSVMHEWYDALGLNKIGYDVPVVRKAFMAGVLAKELSVDKFHELIVNRGVQRVEGMPFAGFIADCARALKGRSGTALQMYLAGGEQDARLLRTHLMLEELSECLEGMARGDELAMFDGLVDLDYVVNGTALTCDLPLAAGFYEVHRSNMTKRRQSTDPEGARVRAKGPDYSPPDLKRILNEHRAKQEQDLPRVPVLPSGGAEAVS